MSQDAAEESEGFQFNPFWVSGAEGPNLIMRLWVRCFEVAAADKT